MSPTNPEILEPFRRYLEVLARVHLDSRLRGKLDPADLVQQVLLRACAALPEVRNRSPEVLTAFHREVRRRRSGQQGSRPRRFRHSLRSR